MIVNDFIDALYIGALMTQQRSSTCDVITI